MAIHPGGEDGSSNQSGASTESWNPQLPEAFVPGSRFLLATKGSGGQPPPAAGIAVNPEVLGKKCDARITISSIACQGFGSVRA